MARVDDVIMEDGGLVLVKGWSFWTKLTKKEKKDRKDDKKGETDNFWEEKRREDSNEEKT